MIAALKPCPFCGAIMEASNYPEDHAPTCWFFVRFQHEFLPNARKPTEEELIAAWNTRVPEQRIRKVFPKILTALGNGAFCSPDVSIEFLEDIPKEVGNVVRRLTVDAQSKP